MATNIWDKVEHQNLDDILGSLLTDITAAKTAIDAMATKLNADAWVTDTDYSAMAALVTTDT